MMASKSAGGIYSGRLQTDGEGNLLAYEAEQIGEKTVTVNDENGNPILGTDGQAISVTVPVFRFGDNHGKPVAEHEGSYVFLSAGEPSHNDRHHQQFVVVDSTVDASQTDDPDLVNADEKNNAHHFGVLPDDPHYEEGATDYRGRVTNMRTRFDPDSVAATSTSHTDAYTGGSNE